MNTPRRAFLIGGLSAATLGAGTWAWLRSQGYQVSPARSPSGGPGHPPLAALPGAPYPPRALATLQALVEILLPGDADLSLPPGSDAGVVEFLQSASREPGLGAVRNDILKLTRFLDQGAQSLRGVRFSELTDPAAQAQLVAEAAAEQNPRGRFVPARAVEATLRLCLEGYLGHPHHGGNRDFSVWQALNIPMTRDRSPAHVHHG